MIFNLSTTNNVVLKRITHRFRSRDTTYAETKHALEHNIVKMIWHLPTRRPVHRLQVTLSEHKTKVKTN